MQKQIQERLAALRAFMQRECVTIYLVFTSDFYQSEYIDEYFKFREYLSGFTGSAGTLLVTPQKAIIWTDGRYILQAKQELAGTQIELYQAQEAGVPSLTEYLRLTAQKDTCIGCDGRTISVSFYQELKSLSENAGVLLNMNLDFAKEIWTDRPFITKKEVYQLPDSIAGVSRMEKLKGLKERISQAGADAYLISDLSGIMWLFNLRGSDIAYNPVAFSYAFVSVKRTVLFLNEGCYSVELEEKLKKDGVEIGSCGKTQQFAKEISGQRLLYDPECFNAVLYESLQANNMMIEKWNEELIEKAVKNKTEISLAKDYHLQDALAVLRFIIEIKERVRTETVTEYEAAQRIDALRSRIKGFQGPSFETICAYGEHAAIVHYTAKPKGSAVLKPKGLLLVDSGGQYLGATTDITRTIVLGELTQEEKAHYTAVLKGLLRLANTKFLEGCGGENLDILAREPIWRLGIDYRHGTGHGIGSFLNVHEGPQAFRYKINKKHPQPALKPGMITSDEPGIYMEGSHGIRLENELLCVEKESTEWGTFLGFETLTLVPFESEAILSDRMNEEERTWLNVYHRNVYETLCPHLKNSEKTWLESRTKEF